MSFDLAGGRVLVTGATGHLGAEICRGLARQGAYVLVGSRRTDAAEALVDDLRAAGGAAEALVMDVTDAEAVADWAEAQTGTPLLCVVNNAYAGPGGTLEYATDADWRAAYEIAVVAAQRLVRLSLPQLRAGRAAHGDASVVNVASMYGRVSPDPRLYATPAGTNPPFYGAAKAALIQATRYMAVELGPEGIRSNAVAPGPFPSESVRAAQPDFVAALAERVPLGRVGHAPEVAGPVGFLAAPAARFVTGAVLDVDGGWTAW